jgi:hypothetical protein
VVDELESTRIPFGVCRTSKMNKALRKVLHDKASLSNDDRKSRRKKIKPGAVQDLLRKIRQLRACDPLISIPPYSD